MRRQPAPHTLKELVARSLALEGATVGALAHALLWPLPSRPVAAKGFVGQLIEACLGSDVDAGERPDFFRLGVELKTVPVKADGSPIGSTFVCSINLGQASHARWQHSRLKARLRHVLWLPIYPLLQTSCGKPAVRYQHALAGRRLGRAVLWQPDKGQHDALEADWTDLMGAVGAGRGGTLTAREGSVLQIRPKAAHARVRTLGPSEIGAQWMLPLGFYLRREFVADILGSASNRTSHF